MNRIKYLLQRSRDYLIPALIVGLVALEIVHFIGAWFAVNEAAAAAVRYTITGQYDKAKYAGLAACNCTSDDEVWRAYDVARIPSIHDQAKAILADLPASETANVVVCSNRSNHILDEATGQCLPTDDPGGVGDSVVVSVRYDYPLGSTFGAMLSLIPMQATVRGTNESYRSAKVINLADQTLGFDDKVATDKPARPPSATDRKIVMNGDLQLQVSAIDDNLVRIVQLTADFGGYIAKSETSGEGNSRFASVEVRIPADRFQDVTDRLKQLATKVLHEQVTGEDVTDRFVDLNARLSSLQATAKRTESLLDKADKVENALKVSVELGKLQEQIEQTQGQIQLLSNQIDFSTINVSLVLERAPITVPTWQLNTTAGRAVGFLAGLGRLALDIAIWAIIVGLPLLVLAFIARQVVRRVRRNRALKDA